MYHYNRKIAEEVTVEQLVDFKTKEEYLAWLEEWRFSYKDLAAKQKVLRQILSKPHDLNSRYLMAERYSNRTVLRMLLAARRLGKHKIIQSLSITV